MNQPENTAETLAHFRRSQASGTGEYASMVERYYKLVTDFYEFGWGRSFHFAPTMDGESLEHAIANHQYFLGDALALKPGMNVLDVGCGVGGPQRSLSQEYGSTITGLNFSEYQLRKCEKYNKESGLDELCPVLLGDFMEIPAEDQSFDAVYHIEALAHAPDKKAAYSEIFRVLKPGGVFAGYEWCMTPLNNPDNEIHSALKEGIEFGNACPHIVSFDEVKSGLRSAGFEVIVTRDRALDGNQKYPWYQPLEGDSFTLKGFPRSTIGRKVTSLALRVLQTLHAIPEGAYEVQEILNIAADSLLAAGALEIFTPMFYHKARKPN